MFDYIINSILPQWFFRVPNSQKLMLYLLRSLPQDHSLDNNFSFRVIFPLKSQGFNQIIYFINQYQQMELIDENLMNDEIKNLIRSKVELECFLCMGEFNQNEYAPMMMCINQHSCCAPCMQELVRVDGCKQISCPHCNLPVNKKAIAKNRHLVIIYQLITAYNRYVAELKTEIQNAKKVTSCADLRGSLSAKQPQLATSFILAPIKKDSFLQQSTLFDDCPTSRSQTWIGATEKRRQLLQTYAQRQKIEQLKKIAQNDTPLEHITKIRSGYGTIKKIECMELFINLKQLLLSISRCLDNNHIRIIEGLNSNIKLNVLSLAYNRIEKAENLGHLKDLKRLSLQCNKLGKASAEYLSHFEWKNLESLTISFHEEQKEDNDECFLVLFTGKSLIQWSGLKNLYIYNSKQVGQRARGIVRQFISKRKNTMQVYWS